jgi:putative protease
LKEGSARAAAGNFTFSQLREMCSFAHSAGVSVYVAVNTLPFGDAETSSFALNAEKAASEGADGVIVQDTGLITLLSEMRNAGRLPPFFRIHVSTQAGLANAGGSRIAKALGADRIILPRELTLEEIAALKAGTDLELETFVHGAMCMGYSGSCLLSSYIGGRSGNRGSCAQPCRMKYRLGESGNVPGGEMREILSPDDLCALPFLDEVCRSGVSSLKIEGRLKSPEYTALTTRIYREALDAVAEDRFGRFIKEELDDALRCLRTMFTRSGGGPGFLLGNTGRSHMTGLSAGRSGALLGNAGNIRSLRTPSGVQNGLSFFSFVLTPLKTASGSRPQAALSPGDGVTLLDDLSGETFGGTVNRIDGNTGEVTVCAGSYAGNVSRFASARVFQTADSSLLKSIRELLSSDRRNVKLPVRLSFSAAPGERAVLKARLAEEGPEVTVQSEEPVKEALTSPLSAEEISARLSKLNDTGFYAFL